MSTEGSAFLWKNRKNHLASPVLSDTLRTALRTKGRFRNAADAREADEGKGVGETVTWTHVSSLKHRGRRLREDEEMPVTTMTTTEGSAVLAEFGNSVPFTRSVETFSEYDIRKVISKNLSADAVATLEWEVRDEFNKTPLRICPAGGTSASAIELYENGTCPTTNNTPLRKAHVATISNLMEERNIPPFTEDGNYVAIGRPTSYLALQDDLEKVAQYSSEGFRRILNGEYGRAHDVIFTKQTEITSQGWENEKSDEVFFYGEDTVTEVVETLEEIRAGMGGDYGRSHGMAWYAVLGFAIVHGGLPMDPKQARIFKWDSSA